MVVELRFLTARERRGEGRSGAVVTTSVSLWVRVQCSIRNLYIPVDCSNQGQAQRELVIRSYEMQRKVHVMVSPKPKLDVEIGETPTFLALRCVARDSVDPSGCQRSGFSRLSSMLLLPKDSSPSQDKSQHSTTMTTQFSTP
jgi:hypothetical protein